MGFAARKESYPSSNFDTGRPHLYVVKPDNTQETPGRTYRKPFAFDLGREYDLIQQHGEKYKEFFISQAHYYAKEVYGRVPVVEYEHEIVTLPNGELRLQFGPHGELARESYKRPAADESLPMWYRGRAFADVQWTIAIEGLLQTAKPGDRFVCLSPTAFDVPYDERKEWSFEWHSFVKVHEYVIEDGKQKLVSRALRNYLDLPEQEVLFKTLSGRKKSGMNILGKVVPVDDTTTIGHIQRLVGELYENTPEERKIVPDECDRVAKEHSRANSHLATFKPWLEGIFYAILQRKPKYLILGEFRGWENGVRSALSGEEVNTEFFRRLRPKIYLRDTSQSRDPVIRGYTEQEYKPGASSCGNGSGFDDEEDGLSSSTNIMRMSGSMNYKSLTSVEDGLCPKIACGNKDPECDWEADEEEAKLVASGMLTNCPECGWSP